MTEPRLLHHDDFEDLVGSTFTATIGLLPNQTLPEGEEEPEYPKVDLELIKTTIHDYPGLEGFSLVFRTDPEHLFEQGIRDIEHETLGKIQLFLTPVIQHSNTPGMYYETVFNRFSEDDDTLKI